MKNVRNADILIRALEPEIDKKCAEIRQKKSEKLLTGIFISVSILLLIIPASLIFFGVSLFAIFVPVIFAGAVFLALAPILISKGDKSYGQI